MPVAALVGNWTILKCCDYSPSGCELSKVKGHFVVSGVRTIKEGCSEGMASGFAAFRLMWRIEIFIAPAVFADTLERLCVRQCLVRSCRWSASRQQSHPYDDCQPLRSSSRCLVSRYFSGVASGLWRFPVNKTKLRTASVGYADTKGSRSVSMADSNWNVALDQT